MIRFFSIGSSSFCPSMPPPLALAVMWYLVFISSLLPPPIRTSGSSHAVPMSAHSGTVVALNRPPGSGAAIRMMLSRFEISPGGLGLTDATSNVVAEVAAGVGAEGVCPDAVVTTSRVTKAKVDVEPMLDISTFDEDNGHSSLFFLRMANTAERPGRQDAGHQRQQRWRKHP